MKKCQLCRESLPLDSFSSNRCKPDGLQGYCRACKRLKQRDYYQRNRAAYTAKNEEVDQRRRAIAREKLLTHLRLNPCVDCGEADPVVLQFDHVRDVKLDSISNMVRRGMAWERIEAEIAKCDIRCANCHFRRTWKQRGWWLKA